MTLQDVISTEIGLPLDALIQQYEADGPFELIHGEKVNVMPGVAEHAEIIKLLYDVLREYERHQGTIHVYSETPYILVYGSNWVTGARVPDLMVFQAARLTRYKAETPDWKKKPFVLIPDLCIEVISPRDVYADVDEKVELYRSDGVQRIWVVNPRSQTVQIFSHNSIESIRLTRQNHLDGGGLLPGFTLAVKDIFPE